MRNSIGILAFPWLLAACIEGSGPIDSGSEPTPMQVLGSATVPTPPYVAEIAVRGSTAYTTTWSFNISAPGNRLDIWDVSGDNPVWVDSVVVSGSIVTLGDVAISDDGQILIVATERAPGMIVVYDISAPRAPVELSRFSSANTGPGVHTAKLGRVNGRLYAFLAVDPGASFNARTVIVDIEDPAVPTEVHVKVADGSFVHDTFIRDEMLFIAHWDEGLILLDLGGMGNGSVTNPREIGRILTAGGEVHNVWWFHDPATGAKRYAFVGQEGPGSLLQSSNGDIHVVDLTTMSAPTEVAFYSAGPGRGPHNFWMDESRGILYAAFYNGGVRAFDVRGDLSACADSERSPDGRCDLGRMGREIGRGLQGGVPVYIWGVRYDAGIVYASDMLGRLWKLNGLESP